MFVPIELPELSALSSFEDARGSMSIFYEGNQFQTRIIKMTHSVKGVLRGFHFQSKPLLQRKKIFLLGGEIQDVLIKIDDQGMPTDEIYESIISVKNGFYCLSIPQNWAHAYLTLSETSDVLYFCDADYGNEVAFNPLTNYGKWKMDESELIISNKDLV